MKHLMTYKIFESVVTRDKDHDLFDYDSIISSAWNPIIKKAQEFQKINFDLENNDSTGEKKTIFIKRDLRKGQPVKYEINAELWHAGGDWECPVMYFKLEFAHDYSIRHKKDSRPTEYVWDLESDYGGLYKCYALIPGPDINHLVETENTKSGDKWYTAYTHDSLAAENLKASDVKITDEDKKAAWKWLEELMEKVVEERHEMLDDPNPPKLSAEPSPDDHADQG